MGVGICLKARVTAINHLRLSRIWVSEYMQTCADENFPASPEGIN